MNESKNDSMIGLKGNWFRGSWWSQEGKNKSNQVRNDAVKAEKSIKMKKIDENKNSVRICFPRSFDSCKLQVFSPTRSVRLRPFFLSCMIFAFQKNRGFLYPGSFYFPSFFLSIYVFIFFLFLVTRCHERFLFCHPCV